jgi:hypothetical protein
LPGRPSLSNAPDPYSFDRTLHRSAGYGSSLPSTSLPSRNRPPKRRQTPLKSTHSPSLDRSSTFGQRPCARSGWSSRKFPLPPPHRPFTRGKRRERLYLLTPRGRKQPRVGWRAQKEGRSTSDSFAGVDDRLCLLLASSRAESVLFDAYKRPCFVIGHEMACKGKAGEGKVSRGAEEVVLGAS